MTNTTKHKIPKLTFNKIAPDRTDDSPSTLEFEYPEGVKHAYSFFFYPDTVVIHDDISNDVVSAKDLCGAGFLAIAAAMQTCMTVDLKFVNSDLFHKYLEIVVRLVNELTSTGQNNLKDICFEVPNTIAPYHFILLSGCFDTVNIGKKDIAFVDIEMSLISTTMVRNIISILIVLIHEAMLSIDN